jgi:hypothetical protein
MPLIRGVGAWNITQRRPQCLHFSLQTWLGPCCVLSCTHAVFFLCPSSKYLPVHGHAVLLEHLSNRLPISYFCPCHLLLLLPLQLPVRLHFITCCYEWLMNVYCIYQMYGPAVVATRGPLALQLVGTVLLQVVVPMAVACYAQCSSSRRYAHYRSQRMRQQLEQEAVAASNGHSKWDQEPPPQAALTQPLHSPPLSSAGSQQQQQVWTTSPVSSGSRHAGQTCGTTPKAGGADCTGADCRGTCALHTVGAPGKYGPAPIPVDASSGRRAARFKGSTGTLSDTTATASATTSSRSSSSRSSIDRNDTPCLYAADCSWEPSNSSTCSSSPCSIQVQCDDLDTSECALRQRAIEGLSALFGAQAAAGMLAHPGDPVADAYTGTTCLVPVTIKVG